MKGTKMTKEKENNFLPMPKEWIGQYYNACNEPCDMLVGPCACGASHHIDEWLISRKKLTESGWQKPPDRINQLRQLLFEIFPIAENDEPLPLKGEPLASFPKIGNLAKQALTLLPCETCAGSGIKPFTKFYYCTTCEKDVSEDHLVTISRDNCKDRCPDCKNRVIEKSVCPRCQ